MSQRKVVFLDRDDTIIEDRIYLNDPNDIVYFPGVFEALRDLRDHGFEFVIVTNQSGIARGIVDPVNVKEIHKRIRDEYAQVGVDILGFYYAPYLPITDHFLRKPKPGMLLEAAQHFNIDLAKSWMVGDRMSDIEAGHRAGTQTVLIGDKEPPENSAFAPPEIQAESLLKAVPQIIALASDPN